MTNTTKAKPIIEEHSQQTQKYNLSKIMLAAWGITRKAVHRLGGRHSAYSPTSLKQAWVRAKALFVKQQESVKSVDAIYTACIDEAINRKTKQVNLLTAEATYIVINAAKNALAILSKTHTKSIIRTAKFCPHSSTFQGIQI